MLVYSVALVLIMIFRPQGIFGNWEFSLTKTINKLFYPMKFKAHGKPKQAETVEKVKASKESGKNAKKTTEKVAARTTWYVFLPFMRRLEGRIRLQHDHQLR